MYTGALPISPLDESTTSIAAVVVVADWREARQPTNGDNERAGVPLGSIASNGQYCTPTLEHSIGEYSTTSCANADELNVWQSGSAQSVVTRSVQGQCSRPFLCVDVFYCDVLSITRA